MTGLRAVIVKNVTVQSVAEAVALACGFISAVLLSRHLGVTAFGAFNYAFAFMYFFVTLNDLGINTVAVREMSKAPERTADLLATLLSLRIVLGLAVLLLAWATIAIWPMEPTLRRPLMVFALVLPLSALHVPSVLFQVSMRLEYGAAAVITTRVAGLAFVLLMIAADQGVTAMFVALLAGELCGLAVVWRFARRLAPVGLRVDRATWSMLLRASAPLALGLVLVALINRVDFILLERLGALEDVGLYGAAYRVTNLLEKFPIFVMATVYPVMSRLTVDDGVQLRRVYRGVFWRFAIMGAVLGLAVVLVAPWLLATGFGEPFRAGAAALRWLVVATCCLYLALAGGNLLIAVGRPRDNALALGVGVVLNIGLNFVLIPIYGVAGAAMATAASFGAVMIVTLIAVERYFVREATA